VESSANTPACERRQFSAQVPEHVASSDKSRPGHVPRSHCRKLHFGSRIHGSGSPRMIYLKSALAGVVGLVVFAAALLCAEFVAATIWIRAHGGDASVGVFVSFPSKSPLVWIIAIVALFIFSSGSCWEYRRVRARPQGLSFSP
jgi:hypothetical protein